QRGLRLALALHAADLGRLLLALRYALAGGAGRLVRAALRFALGRRLFHRAGLGLEVVGEQPAHPGAEAARRVRAAVLLEELLELAAQRVAVGVAVVALARERLEQNVLERGRVAGHGL